jgi:hypothetical protein
MLSIIASVAISHSDPITTESLVQEMVDLSRLTRRSEFAYKTVEASSYDRASLTPGNEAWFANADAAQYIRVEQNQGREEFVMGDFKGPGALVRFWSANPEGVARFYFDGEEVPRLVAKMSDLLQGRVEPWGDFFSYRSSQGTNLYYPFPFEKSLKVTVSRISVSDKAPSIYYQLNTRLYEPGTPTESFVPDGRVEVPKRVFKQGNESVVKKFVVLGKSSYEVKLSAKEASQIERFSVTRLSELPEELLPSPLSPESVMNHVEVDWTFDGQQSVRVPLPDFFGAGVLPSKLETMVSVVDGSRRMTSYLPMPFKKSAVLKLVNHNDGPMEFQVDLSLRTGVKADYVLHGQWRSDLQNSRPIRDMNLVNFEGEGRYVGTVLHVQNPNTNWWGEGDEKVYVDGEAFPSWFGTGTEDYFGYAWCDPTPFSRPYHGQSRADGPANAGQVGNVRWHVMDDIPFKRKIQFDLEMWHWADTTSRYHTTAFWYALPSKWKAPAIPVGALKIIEGVMPPPPVEGAIEGESMIRIVSGGSAEEQSFDGLSRSKQLWWKDAQVGDSLVLKFEVPESGKFLLVANQCMAVDYGVHEVYLNGKSLGVFDYFNNGLKWSLFEYGTVDLVRGEAELKIVSRGSNAKSDPARRMFGLDYVLLKPVK